MIISNEVEASTVLDFAEREGFEPLRDFTVDELEFGYVEHVDWKVAPGCFLTYHQDVPSASQFLTVTGESRELVDRFVTVVQAEFTPQTPADLLGAADRAADDGAFSAAVMRAGLGAPVVSDDRFVEVIRRALEHPDHWVRIAGVWGTAYSGWPVFLPLLDRLAEQDQSDEVRQAARDARVAIEAAVSSS
jgi:hypothetical protein